MTTPAFSPDEINTGDATRAARLKWVVIVDRDTPPGRMVNAVACVSAATGAVVDGLIAGGGADAAGTDHPGLPWSGCSVLATSAEKLGNARAKAVAVDGLLVVDMPLAAQTNRVYDGYLAELATTAPADLAVSAVSIVGERAEVDAIVKRLSLLA
ncbi:hypothetical protein GCM10027413_16950 [Conyzicola nivalis]|uniref:DUF2000 domain-containing protein n=1 Tax=Conyzicola nivalis TaxID=1477021 RepID=A0A916SH71_9MICO|nr:DUF2000 domain-containing protein [Conyzicola nivalis]GGA97276.1 hypothetical protein GCM10010979_09670 [Conyzicola nivalis]